MPALAGRPFLKMNGLGNEIVVLDLRAAPASVSAEEARAIGAAPGLHYDQMMVMHAPRTAGTDSFVKIFNIDGSLAGACGNGTRCVAYALLRDTDRRSLTIETAAGLLACTRTGDRDFSVDMGRPRFGWRDIPLAREQDTLSLDLRLPHVARQGDDLGPVAVSMGNPHAIFFVAHAGAYDITAVGPQFEHDPLFPERANISLAEIRARDHIKLDVWERGTGRTLACGTAACASLVAAVRRGLTDRRAHVTLPGGNLAVEWRADDHVIMAGPTELEHEGTLAQEIFAGVPA
jgi:diaminopimelate epimerase